MNENVINKWNELKLMVESNEIDVLKNANGNASAGVRARHGLRQFQRASAELVRLLLETDKVNRATRKG